MIIIVRAAQRVRAALPATFNILLKDKSNFWTYLLYTQVDLRIAWKLHVHKRLMSGTQDFDVGADQVTAAINTTMMSEQRLGRE